MKCPVCSSTNGRVTETRTVGAMLRRRRKCSCGVLFTTYEAYASMVDRSRADRAVRGARERIRRQTVKDTILARSDLTSGQLAQMLKIPVGTVTGIRCRAGVKRRKEKE